MRIAIIGWGSLLWDLENLAPHVVSGWSYGGGPRLPLEFSRVSPKRKHGLVVIIDPDHGVPCPTSHIESVRSELGAAVDDLAARERAPVERIGHAHLETGQINSSNPPLNTVLTGWLEETHFDACVWTDLPANFQEHWEEPFSISEGIKYLKTLDPVSLDEAKRYIENAPQETVTPLREALADDPWWQSIPLTTPEDAT
ncbi:MAG: hypothetical protein ACR2OR_07565 [Hyphomicrobiales bacterium]